MARTTASLDGQVPTSKTRLAVPSERRRTKSPISQAAPRRPPRSEIAINQSITQILRGIVACVIMATGAATARPIVTPKISRQRSRSVSPRMLLRTPATASNIKNCMGTRIPRHVRRLSIFCWSRMPSNRMTYASATATARLPSCTMFQAMSRVDGKCNPPSGRFSVIYLRAPGTSAAASNVAGRLACSIRSCLSR